MRDRQRRIHREAGASAGGDANPVDGAAPSIQEAQRQCDVGRPAAPDQISFATTPRGARGCCPVSAPAGATPARSRATNAQPDPKGNAARMDPLEHKRPGPGITQACASASHLVRMRSSSNAGNISGKIEAS